MKIISAILVALWVSTCWTNAQTASLSRSASSVNPGQTAPSDTPYAVTERGASHRVWQRTTYETTPDGRQIPQIHKYTELATGLNFWNSTTGQWQESQELIESFPGGAIARQGQHKVIFANNLATVGAIDMHTPDGQRMRSHVLGLSYFDTASGQSVLIAEVKDSQGQLYPPNVVIYPDAFTDFKADVRYTYTRAGFEQDIILHERPPGPEAYGLNPATTRLQVLTEFLNPPQPKRRQMPSEARPEDTKDEVLDFGTMQMGRGKAFSLERGGGDIPVSKQWLKLEGRDFLVEEVAMPDIDEELQALPAAEGASLNPAAGSVLHVVSKQQLLPAMPLVQVGTNEIQLARLSLPAQGLVLDYQLLNGCQTNYTFQGDTTYYISGPLSSWGTNTFEGGAVIKFATNSTLWITPGPPGTSPGINWKAGAYRPVIFTAKDDNTVGESIGTGNPTGYYGDPMLFLAGFSPQGPLTGLRMSYAKTGIQFGGASANLNSVQFINCQNGLILGGANVFIGNALFANTKTNFIFQGGATVTAQNATFSGSLFLATSTPTQSGSTLIMTNCILANVTNLFAGVFYITNGDYNGFYNAPEIFGHPITNNFYPFQQVGAGSYYLTNGCNFFNQGITNIDSILLAALRQKTTYPPIVYSNTTISVATNFSPQAQRDTDIPDLGYHYDPLDYVFGGVDLYSNLTVTAGTAVGYYADYGSVYSSGQPYGISLNNGANLTSIGTATSPCWIVRYNTVQEGGNGHWTATGWMGGIMFNGSGSGITPQLNGHFTKWASAPGGGGFFRDNWAYGVGSFSDCEFYGSSIGSYRPSLYFTNCLFSRVFTAFWDQMDAANLTFQNCTFYEGALAMGRASWQSPSFWTVRNSAFDGTVFSWSDNFNGDAAHTAFDYNAYNSANTNWQTYPYPYPPNYGTLEVVGSHDVTNIISFNWQSSWLGNYYLPTNSLLINHGNTNANLLGLYHYTTQTNQVKETNSVVDIGYHYVAVDANGIPIDTNGDGIPDYLEDANGNGLNDPGETPWSVAIVTQPQGQSAYVGDSVSFSVTATGVAPLSYQWYYNGTNLISGATNATLTLSPVLTNNAGSYFVVVSNVGGSTNSATANLYVYLPAYPVLYGTLTNYTFQGDTTYYIAGTVYLNGTNNIFEGGAVLKYATNASVVVSIGQFQPAVQWQASAYRPVIFTAKDDNSVGQAIHQSTGNPTNYYANPALSLIVPSFAPTISNFRIAYAKQAMYLVSVSPLISNGQIVNCQNGITVGGGGGRLENVLFANVRTNFNNLGGASFTAQNVTFSGSGCLITQPSQYNSFSFANCIFANVTNLYNIAPVSFSGSNNGFYNSPTFGTSPFTNAFYPFQTVGAGSYYLTNGCVFFNAGTTNVNPNLLAGLRTKTIYPPLVTSGTYLSSTQALTLGPRVPRDTNGTPSLGYHYDPLDYLWSQVSIGPPVTLINGVAVGLFGTLGFTSTGGGLNSQGRAEAMNRLVWYPSVQEQPVRLNNVSTVGSALFTGLSGSTPKLITLRFTDLPMLGSRQPFFDQCYSYSGPIVNVRDSWLRGINLTVNQYFVTGFLGASVSIQNCMLERSTMSLSAGYVNYYVNNGVVVVQNPLNVTLFNNLFWHSSLGLANLNLKTVSPYYSYMTVRDNLFDTSTFTFAGDGNYTNYMNVSNNGYYQTTDGFPGSNDLTINNLAYAVGPLGPWYINSSSPSVVNQGSRLASTPGLGLYHFTMFTNLLNGFEIKETNSIVDIGFHYVATDSNGNPIDSNGDGIPDYFQDANGNGLVDAGETNWGLAILTQPVSQVVPQGANVTFTVTAGGMAPLSYQWQFNNNPLTDGDGISGSQSPVLTLNNVQTTQAGNYTVVVANAAGSVTSAQAVLTVNCPPVIITQPENQTVFSGSTVTFQVQASSTLPLTYQWQHEGTNVPGATSATLTLANVQNTQAGNYNAIVSNAAGKADSSPAVLITLSLSSANSMLQITAAGVSPTAAYDIYAQPCFPDRGYVSPPTVNYRVCCFGSPGQSVFTFPFPTWSGGAFFDAGSANDDDGDGLTFGYEHFVSGSNPDLKFTKNDGIPDGWKVEWGLDPTINNASQDPDGDNMSNLQEYNSVTDPFRHNTTGTPRPVVTIAPGISTATVGGADATFVITRTGSTTASLTVNFTVGGTAIYNKDYTLSPSPGSFYPFSINIPASQSTATITVHALASNHGIERVILGLVPISLGDNPSPATWAYVVDPYHDRGMVSVQGYYSYTYTTTSQFNQGLLEGVNDTVVGNQLQLNSSLRLTGSPNDNSRAQYPYVNVACSARGTVTRVLVRDIIVNGTTIPAGTVAGEYWTAPVGRGRNPSRTTVDQYGNVWVGNRDEGSGNKGSITCIGLVIGGTRGIKNPDGSFTPDPSGEYLKPPFIYNTCIDRDGDGLIHTTYGLADILPWQGNGDPLQSGVDMADDEAIIEYVRTDGTQDRTIAVNRYNDVWIGGYGDRSIDRVDALIGLAQFAVNPNAGGYGGVIDQQGVLWSSQGLVRLVPDNNNPPNSTYEIINDAMGNYGIAADPHIATGFAAGFIWYVNNGNGYVYKLDPGLNPVQKRVLAGFSSGEGGAKGVVVDDNGHLWVGHDGSSRVGHLLTDGTFVYGVPVGNSGNSAPYGVSVDSEDKIWAACYGDDSVVRIDPSKGTPVTVSPTHLVESDILNVPLFAAEIYPDSSVLTTDDINDLDSLAYRLYNETDDLSAYIHQYELSTDTQDLLAQYEGGDTSVAAQLTEDLVTDLNIFDNDYYYIYYVDSTVTAYFDSLSIPSVMTQWPYLPGAEFARQNRLLIELAYPEITPTTQDGVAFFVHTQLSSYTYNLLAQYVGGNGTVAAQLISALVIDINGIIDRTSSIYERSYPDSQRFLGITLRTDTVNLMATSPSGPQLAQLNRMLLEDGFAEIAHMHSVTLPPGQADLRVDLDANEAPVNQYSYPYNYSDMTGFNNHIANPSLKPYEGYWIVMHDSTINGMEWGTVSWNPVTQSSGGRVEVYVRAADTRADVYARPFVPVDVDHGGPGNGVALTGVNGRFLEIRVALVRDSLSDNPILTDLTVSGKVTPTVIINVQPENQYLLEGETATFSVFATGNEPVTYQWLCNGNPISGATGLTLTVPDVHCFEDGNVYSVLVKDASTPQGLLSDEAVLSVDPQTIFIPNNASAANPPRPYPAHVNVAGLPTTVSKVTVNINGMNLTHPGNVSLLLVGPAGQTVLLMSGAGAAYPISNVYLVFDNDYSSLPNNSTIYTGTYKPTAYSSPTFPTYPSTSPAPPSPPYGTDLSVFNGHNPNGTWYLYAYDGGIDVGHPYVGTINGSWCITITP